VTSAAEQVQMGQSNRQGCDGWGTWHVCDDGKCLQNSGVEIDGKRPPGRPRRKSEDNNEWILHEQDGIYLA
jgi:hypothetical protein